MTAARRRQRFVAVLAIVLAVLVYENRCYVTHGRRGGKYQKHGARGGHPDATGPVNGHEMNNNDMNDGDDGDYYGEINVCALEQKTTINVFCYCDDSAPRAATSADCWVFNDGEPRDSPIWREFRSQPNVTKLTFNVRGSTSQTLSFVPTEALARLPELRTLEIVYADIKTVHSHAFANLSRLQDLALGRNNIVRLSRESIAHMDDLRVVTLGDNYVDGISNDVFARLPALRKLYMDRNNISYVAEGAFEQLRKLEELDVSENRLSGSLSRYVFLGLVALRRLDMRANHLDRIGPDAFAELVSLEELVLEDNAIKTVDGRGFAGLVAVQRIALAENRLTALDDRTFRGLDKLKYVDIRFNDLKTLAYGAVEPIYDRLRNATFYLYLQGNMFNCDCSLLWMNRLAAETSSEQVNRAMSDAQCLMNDTADYGDGVSADSEAAGSPIGGGGGGGKKTRASVPQDSPVFGPVDGGGDATDVNSRIYDESKVTRVSALDENTCPGKERPLVDDGGAPDAAQNSDRVLWETANGSSSADRALRRPSAPQLLFPLLLVFALRSRRRC